MRLDRGEERREEWRGREREVRDGYAPTQAVCVLGSSRITLELNFPTNYAQSRQEPREAKAFPPAGSQDIYPCVCEIYIEYS